MVAFRVCIEPNPAPRRASFERSARRALQKMVKDDVLIAIGTGGRGQPFRYFPHPFLIGMMDDKAKARELLQALDA